MSLSLPPAHFSLYKNTFIALTIYFIFWTVAPLVLAQSVALDVSEGVNWGHEWQWGYFKHPPFSSWVLYSVYAVAGDVGVNFLTQLCSFSGAYFAYRLGCVMMSRQKALLGSVLLFFISYYSYPSLEFNHNVAQLPLWTGMAWVFYLAISTPQQAKNWAYWLMVGVLGGVGMLTKYHMAFLLVTMALYLLLPSQRYWLKSPKPWVAMSLMVVIFLPHLVWLTQHDWLPFSYLHSRIESDNAWLGHFSWLAFMGLQLASVLAFIGAVKVGFGLPIFASLKSNLTHFWQSIKHNPSSKAPANDYFYLQFMLIVPLLLVNLCSILGGMTLVNLWAMPMWGLLGLVVVANLPETLLTLATPKILSLLVKWLIFATLVKVFVMIGLVRINEKPSRINYPQQAISEQVATTWQTVSHCPLDSLSGDRWITAISAMRQPAFSDKLSGTFPSLMIAGSPAYSPWMSQDRLREHGTLVLWELDNPVTLPLLSMQDSNPLSQPFDKADFVISQGSWAFAWRDMPHKPPLQIGWIAYVPKACAN